MKIKNIAAICKRRKREAAENAGQYKVDPETGAVIEPESEAGDNG